MANNFAPWRYGPDLTACWSRASVGRRGPHTSPVVRINRIATSQASWLADCQPSVHGKAPLDNYAPSSDNSQEWFLCLRRVPAYAESPALAPSPCAVDVHAADAPGGCGPHPPTRSALSGGARRRKPFSAQTVGHVSGAPRQAETHDQCNPPCPGLALALVRLASGLGCGATRDLSPLASAGIPLVLEMEIQTGSTTDSSGAASADSPDGPRQSDVGPGADRP